MKIKNVGELKKYLEQFPDKMEIKLYNSMVEDWTNITVNEDDLVKEKASYLLYLINSQNELQGKPKIDKLSRISGEYVLINTFLEEDLKDHPEEKKNYLFKKILLFQGTSRNKSTFDRLGSIDY